MKSQFICAGCLFVIMFLLIPVYGQQQWPMVNACRERTSWAAEEDALYPPLSKEHVYVGRNYCAHEFPTWYKNTLIVSIQLESANIFAWNTEATDTLWTRFFPDISGTIDFCPAQNDSIVFVGGQSCQALYALNRSTGQIKWSRPITNLIGRNPIPDGDRLYIVKDSLLCLNSRNGATIWSYPFTGVATPAVDDSCCYLCGRNKIRAFNKITGAMKWERYNNIGHYATLMVDETRVYSVSTDSLVARNKKTGAIEWGYRVAGAEFPDLVVGGAAVCDSFICFIIWESSDGFGQLFTLNKADGSFLWNHNFLQAGLYAPTIANNVVYITTWKEMDLWGFDLKSGDSLFYDNSQDYEGQIIVANHTLYAGTQTGVTTFVSAENKVDNKKSASPHSFVQWHNYPNPFNPATTIVFNLPERANVEIAVYDITGRKVRTLLHERRGSGEHSISWDGRDDAGLPVSSGVYLCKLSTDAGFTETKKMTLVK